MNEREYTIEEVKELMRIQGLNPNNWVQFCAFVNRNFNLEIK